MTDNKIKESSIYELAQILWTDLKYAFSLPEYSGGWIYEYQAMIAGLLALLSAAITVWVMRNHHNDLKYTKNLAARAFMQDSASEICAYYKKLFEYLYNEINKSDGSNPRALRLREFESPQFAL